MKPHVLITNDNDTFRFMTSDGEWDSDLTKALIITDEKDPNLGMCEEPNIFAIEKPITWKELGEYIKTLPENAAAIMFDSCGFVNRPSDWMFPDVSRGAVCVDTMNQVLHNDFV